MQTEKKIIDAAGLIAISGSINWKLPMDEPTEDGYVALYDKHGNEFRIEQRELDRARKLLRQ